MGWARLLGSAGWESATSSTVGLDGAVYVAGFATSIDGQLGSGSADAFITRIRPDGTKDWTRLYGGSGDDRAEGLTTGSDGAIYMAANWNGNYVARLNLDGTKVWSTYLDGDYATSVTTEKNGNVYVSSIGWGKAVISCVNTDGSVLSTFELAGNEEVVPFDLKIDVDRSIYLVGTTNSSQIDGQTGHGGWDAFVTKFNPDGTKAWTQLLGGIGEDSAQSVVLGTDGSLYVAGYTFADLEGQINNGFSDAFITRFDKSGNKEWTRLVGKGYYDNGDCLANGGNGFVYMAGRLDEQAFVNLYSPDGSVVWTKILQGAYNVSSLTTSAHGSLYAAGLAYDDIYGQARLGDGDAFLLKFKAPYNTIAFENSKRVTTIAPADALLGTAPKFSLKGADASLFKVSSKGVLTFATVKDYEQPVDVNKDGVYEVSVTLTNAKTGYKVVKDLTVSVEFLPIIGTTGADRLIVGTAGWDTLDGWAGDDRLFGGTGLDTFLVTRGRDTILYFNHLTKGAVGSEILRVSEGATADATLKAAWTATNDSFNYGTANLTTKGMTIDLSGITNGQGWNVTNKGAATMITGSRFDDVLIGGSGNDQLLGGTGHDVLAGGKGFDILTGGAGNDTFRLGGDTKTDHITDFLSGTDLIELDHLLYNALGTGQLAANQFAQGTAATSVTQRIVYDQPSGNLWYDLDGSAMGNAVLIVVLDNHVQVALTDFYLI